MPIALRAEAACSRFSVCCSRIYRMIERVVEKTVVRTTAVAQIMDSTNSVNIVFLAQVFDEISES